MVGWCSMGTFNDPCFPTVAEHFPAFSNMFQHLPPEFPKIFQHWFEGKSSPETQGFYHSCKGGFTGFPVPIFPVPTTLISQRFPKDHWIDLRENLRETSIFNGKNNCFRLKFSLKPIQWKDVLPLLGAMNSAHSDPTTQATRQEPNDATAKASVQLTGPAATLLLEASDENHGEFWKLTVVDDS